MWWYNKTVIWALSHPPWKIMDLREWNIALGFASSNILFPCAQFCTLDSTSSINCLELNIWCIISDIRYPDPGFGKSLCSLVLKVLSRPTRFLYFSNPGLVHMYSWTFNILIWPCVVVVVGVVVVVVVGVVVVVVVVGVVVVVVVVGVVVVAIMEWTLVLS